MASNSWKNFLSLLRQEWMPFLSSAGFKGDGESFQRTIGDVIHVIRLQKNKYGGSCCVNQIAALIKPEDLDNEWRIVPEYAFASGRAGLTMARIHKHLGNHELARRFAKAGLQRIGKAKALLEELEKLSGMEY